ncbi:MAG: methyltransferase domain-containing protein, partial [Solirubrobacteraceae bacterium]
GCSQGIVALLLGREGRHVTGIDREADAIAEASRRLEQEEDDVKARVRFIHADGAALELATASFDSVLMTEVVEHQVDPRPLIEEARRLLRPAGTLVLTMPYGLFPHPDHKEPTYLGRLVELLSPHYTVETLELIHHYVGVVAGARTEPAGGADIWRRVVELAEERLATQDLACERMRDQIQRLREEAAHASAQGKAPAATTRAENDDSQQQRPHDTSRVPELETTLAAAQAEADHAQLSLTAALERAESLCNTLETTARRLAALQRRGELLAQSIRERDDQLLSLRSEHEALLRRCSTLERNRGVSAAPKGLP